MTTTTPEYKALEQLRTRFSQLQASINLFRHELESTQPLPPWPSIQTASSNLAATLQNLATVLAVNRPLLSSAHAYPTSAFPGLTQEAFLQQLLRKKMDPKAEDWIDQELDKQPENMENCGELWQSAGGLVKEMREELEEGVWGDYFTVDEHETGVKDVQTGIKRPLWDDDEDEEEEEGDEDADGNEKMGDDGAVGGRQVETAARKVVQPHIPLETLLKLAVGGASLSARANT